MESSSSENFSGQTQNRPAIKLTGLIKLVSQAMQKKIEPEVFLDEVYEIFKQIESTQEELKQIIASAASGTEAEFYGDMLLDDIGDIYYFLHLGLMQFESFVNCEDAAGLRIGMQLVQKGIELFNELASRTQAIADNNNLYDSKDAVCAVGSEVLRKRMDADKFSLAMDQLGQLFDIYLGRAGRSHDSVINDAKSLIDFAEEPDHLRAEAARIMEELRSWEDDCGLLILAVHNPEYVKKIFAETVVQAGTEI